MNIRKFFRISHRLFGILVGFYFALLGLTGSYLAYGDYFEETLNPNRFKLVDLRGDLELNQLISNVQNLTGQEMSPLKINIPSDRKKSIQLSFDVFDGNKKSLLTYFYDPVNNKIIDQKLFSPTIKGFSSSFIMSYF